ncbi:MAG: type II toxin-antitoxin system RelE/ParE family toxin [Bacteroidales bacterium]|nr:type II toxin-antitoxin system RelE/ParE family toxin [Bacteroidales bacterium]
MEKRAPGKILEVSDQFKVSFDHIHDYTLETFGIFQAERYVKKIEKMIDTLPMWYSLYPECRHIQTKSQMYRNIVLDAHLIVYRITKQRIEVLDIIHSSSSISKIRSTRKIHV